MYLVKLVFNPALNDSNQSNVYQLSNYLGGFHLWTVQKKNH